MVDFLQWDRGRILPVLGTDSLLSSFQLLIIHLQIFPSGLDCRSFLMVRVAFYLTVSLNNPSLAAALGMMDGSMLPVLSSVHLFSFTEQTCRLPSSHQA